MPEFLTTRELAELLRIKERKVYELAAAGEVPCAKVTGKLLFPEREVRRWLAAGTAGGGSAPARQEALGVERRPTTLLGSHDPLLEWAVRESRSGLAIHLDGSLDGLERFERAEGVACGLHLFEPSTGGWNVAEVTRRFTGRAAALIGFVERRRGLLVAEGSAIGSLADLAGRRLVPRQPASGAHALFAHLLAESGTAQAGIEEIEAVRSEVDAALAVLHGHADAAFGLEALARQYRLGFVPLVTERFDLLVERRAWFEPSLQRLAAFAATERFAARAAELGGYALGAFGEVRWNG